MWRYFRHTWSLEYRSIPGRQLPILIRNRARPGRPLIGIAMLASPILRTRTRDNWIGWSPEAFNVAVSVGSLEAGSALALVRDRIEASLTEIRWDDLISERDLAEPSERTILKLVQRGAGAQAARMRELEEHFTERRANEAVPASLRSGKEGSPDRDWLADSETNLFVRKRAETLADLLAAKQFLTTLDWSARGAEMWNAMQRHPQGLKAIATALTEVRKCGLASQIADLSVCGAIPPYNSLLGGKLVALLVASDDVRKAWTHRYSGQISIIASQMAGRPICRSADLRMLTTTSLYGMASSQYNRLRLRASEYPNLGRDIVWEELEHTTGGYGTVHLGQETVRALRARRSIRPSGSTTSLARERARACGRCARAWRFSGSTAMPCSITRRRASSTHASFMITPGRDC
ncbi:MAG: Druantia anti-phage system protein DruA [Microvirga sp.]